MSKKIPISFNNAELRVVESLENTLGLSGTYGSLPRSVKFSIMFTQNWINQLEKLIPDLNEPDLDILLSSIKRLKIKKYKEEKVQIAKKEADEYNLQNNKNPR